MSANADIVRAEAAVAERRRRLGATANALKARLKPAALAQDAVEKIVDASENAAQAGIDLVKRNPLPALGVAAAITAFFARRPIMRLLRIRKPTAAPKRTRTS